MKKWFLFVALVLGMAMTANAQNGKESDETLRKSSFPDGYGPASTTFPHQFNETNTVRNGVNRAVSTGYYFVDSDDEAPDYWRPNVEIADTTEEPTLWRRIIQGPRIFPPSYWDQNPNEGLRFFRNPAEADYFNHDKIVDSTDNAIAGPIPIGFGFYFNGIRYDSFYVSTNGVIALSNRRYFYNANGEKVVPPGATSCYDPMSMDWFSRGRLPGDGLTDATPDNWGYQYAVLGNAPTTATAGIRAAGGQLQNMSTTANRGAYIAPFWGPLHLSQYDPVKNLPDDWGKVYFKRSINSDKLIIYFVNVMFQAGTYGVMNGTWSTTSNRRPGPGYVAAKAQVVLNRLDSSVTILYESFDGLAPTGFRPTPASDCFRGLTTAGVTGWARDVNFDSKTGTGTYPWGTEYQQTTHYFSNYVNPAGFPHNSHAIKFKQWQNTVRVVDIQYRVRKQDANADLKFTEKVTTAAANNYELLAGEERIGAIQPVALIQNLTNDIQGPQGINYVPQDLSFRARFRIINLVNNRIVYNRLVHITKTCLDLPADQAHPDCQDDPFNMVRYSTVTKSGSNYTATNISPINTAWTGIPPYNFVQVYFPPFEPNEFVPDHIGRMRAFIVADPTDPVSKEGLGDKWPFDDTTSVNLFVMKRLRDFKDDVTEYHLIERVYMPSVYKWVNIEGDVVGGDQVSRYPLPPRGLYAAANNENVKLESPAIRLNRKKLDGSDYNPLPDGDKILSFPIDIRDKFGAVLSFSVQRTNNGPQVTWDRGWSDNSIIGCEPRIVMNQSPFQLYTTAASIGQPSPDSLLVELMKPSPDGIQFITNTHKWNWHPRRPTKDVPNPTEVNGIAAFALFGGGGYFVGWNELDRNEPLLRESAPNLNGLRFNLYDDGIDWEYSKFFVAIPDTFVSAPAEGGKNFRFRMRVNARDHKKCMTCIADDNDEFFIDNIRILFPSEITDIEVSTVKILWPYEVAPASQATEIPIRVVVSNNTEVNAPTFTVKVKIFRGQTTQGAPVYCRTWTVSNLNARNVLEVPLPTWNARQVGAGNYRLQAMVIVPGGDLEELNDTSYSDIKLTFGEVFAYDKVNNPENNVPDPAFSGFPGAGLSTYGYNYGGTGTPTSYNSLAPQIGGNGAGSGSGSGQFAAKFTLLNTDTIYGFQAYFAGLNQAMDDIAFAIYSDQGGQTPNQPIQNSTIYAQRGLGSDMTEPKFNEYVTYKLTSFGKKPVVLNRGTYWVTVAQMGLDGLHLGGAKYRMGMRTTSQYVGPNNDAGTSGINVMIDKQYRIAAGTDGKQLINNNFFAYENTRGYGQWGQFMPTATNPGYAHLHHFGTSPVDGQTQTFSRGTWIPMLRPYFGMRASGGETVVQYCPDDIPVELTSFRADVRAGVGVDLFWETASEKDNYGFYIEKRTLGQDENAWSSIDFVAGGNNSNTVRHYSYTDKNVTLNESYQYRLRQVDFDGTQYCHATDMVDVTYDLVEELTLLPNSPNPFTNNTNIEFNMPSNSKVRLEVLDIFGNTVRVLVDGELGRGKQSINWDGRNTAGTMVPAGTYIYRLTNDGEVLSGKMTVVR